MQNLFYSRRSINYSTDSYLLINMCFLPFFQAVVVFAFVFCSKFIRRRFCPNTRLFLHICTVRGCKNIVLWRGNNCPSILRFEAGRLPENPEVRGLFSPRLVHAGDAPVLRNSVLRIREQLTASVPLSFWEALHLRGLLRSGVLSVHYEFCHKGQITVAKTTYERNIEATNRNGALWSM